MGLERKAAVVASAVGYQLRMCAEMHGISVDAAVERMIRSGVPTHMSGLIEEPLWRPALFEAEGWADKVRELEAPLNLQAMKYAARMIAAEAAAVVAAHAAYEAALANVGAVFEAEGIEGLKKAAASCPAVADKPGLFPIATSQGVP